MPPAIRKAESDVIRERVAAQQQLERLAAFGPVDMVRTAPAQQVIGTFAQQRAEAHLFHRTRDARVNHQLGVAEHDGFVTKGLADRALLRRDLRAELIEIGQGRQGVVRGLAQELHRARIGQGHKAVERLGRPELHLFDRGTADRIRAAELAFGLGHQLMHQLVHRDVALLGHALDDARVLGIVKVVLALTDVEEGVAPQAERLVHLEIEADCCHAGAPTTSR